jgi:hypothetical protein
MTLRGLVLLKPKQICAKLGCGKTKFWEDYVATGKIKLIKGGLADGTAPEHEIDELIQTFIDARDPEEPPARSPKISKMLDAKRAKRAAALIAEQSKSTSKRRSRTGSRRPQRGAGGHPGSV